MAVIEEYVARKAFTYDNERYQPGDIWQPAGKRYDRLLIEQRTVYARQRPATSTPEDADKLMELTNRKLRQRLRDLDLPVYGTKAELVARLLSGGEE